MAATPEASYPHCHRGPSAAVVNYAHQRAEDDARVAALTRDIELDRLARLDLTALLDLEEAERKQKLLMRLHHMAGGRHRVGSQGGAQSRFSRVCRQYFGEPAHREPGRCCCGQPATSPRGASCDRCRERNRHYRRRYRAKVRRASSRLGAHLPRADPGYASVWVCPARSILSLLRRPGEPLPGRPRCPTITAPA